MTVRTDVEGRRSPCCSSSCALSWPDPWRSPSTVSACVPVCMCACVYVYVRARARGRVYKCHLHICVHMRRGERAHGRLSITCCVSRRDSFRGGRGRRERETTCERRGGRALAGGRETARWSGRACERNGQRSRFSFYFISFFFFPKETFQFEPRHSRLLPVKGKTIKIKNCHADAEGRGR